MKRFVAPLVQSRSSSVNSSGYIQGSHWHLMLHNSQQRFLIRTKSEKVYIFSGLLVLVFNMYKPPCGVFYMHSPAICLRSNDSSSSRNLYIGLGRMHDFEVQKRITLSEKLKKAWCRDNTPKMQSYLWELSMQNWTRKILTYVNGYRPKSSNCIFFSQIRHRKMHFLKISQKIEKRNGSQKVQFASQKTWSRICPSPTHMAHYLNKSSKCTLQKA